MLSECNMRKCMVATFALSEDACCFEHPDFLEVRSQRIKTGCRTVDKNRLSDGRRKLKSKCRKLLPIGSSIPPLPNAEWHLIARASDASTPACESQSFLFPLPSPLQCWRNGCGTNVFVCAGPTARLRRRMAQHWRGGSGVSQGKGASNCDA